jgi:hypothetical protein
MRKIIEGKAYDTATAQHLGNWNNGLGSHNFKWCVETLFRTSNGRYFLYGEGGPASRWARSLGDNSSSEGRDLRVLDEQGARQWVETHLRASDYEDIFGEAAEG